MATTKVAYIAKDSYRRREAFLISRERHRLEDRLVDLLITAESLYVPREARSELTYRLALNAARFFEPSDADLTRKEVFELMKSAYAVRSTTVHGDAPDRKQLKVAGAQVGFEQFVLLVEEVVRQGVIHALGNDGWPPDWIGLYLT